VPAMPFLFSEACVVELRITERKRKREKKIREERKRMVRDVQTWQNRYLSLGK